MTRRKTDKIDKTDNDLILEIRRGNQASFEELISRYAAKAFSLATRFTKSQQDAEEVLQDVFVTVHRKINNFEGKSSFSSWLYRITVNASLMKLRKKRRDQTVSIEDMLPHVQDMPTSKNGEIADLDHLTYRSQLRTVLENAIRKLPEEYRPVFVLRDVDGLTNREVSKILNITVPAVKSRLHRSRLMLRRRLGRVFDEIRARRSTSRRAAVNE